MGVARGGCQILDPSAGSPSSAASGGRAGLGPRGKVLGRSCQARHTGSSIIASGAISSPLLNLERGRREGKRPRFLPSPPLPSRGAHHLGRAGASSAASGLTSPGRRAGDAGRGREPCSAEAARGAGRGGAARSRRHGSAPSRRAPRGRWAGLPKPRPLAEPVSFRERGAVGSGFQSWRCGSRSALRPDPVQISLGTDSAR